MNDPPQKESCPNPGALFAAQLKAEWAAEDEAKRQKLSLDDCFTEFNGLDADTNAVDFFHAIEAGNDTRVSNQQVQDDASIELNYVAQGDFSSQFVPCQKPKPVKAEVVTHPVVCDYLSMSANLEEKATNYLRVASQPFKQPGDILGLMVNIFGPECSSISNANVAAIVIKILGLAESILSGGEVAALANDARILFDPLRRPPGRGSTYNIIIPPLELGDRAKGLVVTSLLPAEMILTRNRADHRFMSAFFRHALPGINDILVMSNYALPIGPAVNCTRAAHDVVTWLTKTFGEGLVHKCHRTVRALSTVYGPVPVPVGAENTRFNLATPTRVVQTAWVFDAHGRIIPGCEQNANLPVALDPAPPLGHWTGSGSEANSTRPIRPGQSDGSPGDFDLRKLARANLGINEAIIHDVSLTVGQPANPYMGEAAVPGTLTIVWDMPAGMDLPVDAPARPAILNMRMGVPPAWATPVSQLYQEVARYATGAVQHRGPQYGRRPGYVPPNATRDGGVRDVYGLIDAHSRDSVPCIEAKHVAPLLCGFLRLQRNAKPSVWPMKTGTQLVSDIHYRGRLFHYLFNCLRYALQQDPVQTDESNINGRDLVRKLKDPLSVYCGPFRLDRTTDPGAGLECMESPLIFRTAKFQLPLYRFQKHGIVESKRSGAVVRLKVGGNNRTGLDACMRALGANNNVGDVLLDHPSFVPALVLDLAAVPAPDGNRIIANFSVPTHHRAAIDDAKLATTLRVRGVGRSYFSGDTCNLPDRIA